MDNVLRLNEWLDISNEQYREYDFGDGRMVRIEGPDKLHVKRKDEGDSHRILDVDGVSHYIPVGWVKIEWEVHEGKPFFDF